MSRGVARGWVLALLGGLSLGFWAGCGDCPREGGSVTVLPEPQSVSQGVARDIAAAMVPSGVVVRGPGGSVNLLGRAVRVGDRAPDFECAGVGNRPESLSSYAGKVRILSVFPSIDTRVCSLQTRSFNEEASSLSEDVVILSISADLPFALGRYCGAAGLDTSRMRMCSDYARLDFGLKYGMVLDGSRLLTRAVVVVDGEGVVRHVEYVEDLSREPDYEGALSCARGLLE